MGRSSSLLLWCSLISSHHLCHEAAHGLCGFVLLLTGGVGVGAESEPRIVVPQHTADSFHVHAVLQGQCGKGVSEIVPHLIGHLERICKPKKSEDPVIRQNPLTFGTAFSVALMPPFWRCRRSGRSPPWSAPRRNGERAGFDPAHPAPQWLSADFQAGGS